MMKFYNRHEKNVLFYQSISDKGIKEHRITQVVYTTNTTKDEKRAPINLSRENLDPNKTIVLENILFYY